MPYFFYFHDFFQTSPDCQQPTCFVYWFIDEVRSIKEVQKASGPFWIYILIFTQPIWFIHVFLLFSIYCNIYNVTNLIKDVYEVNNGRQYQFKSNFWTHMNIMRRRSIFKDINRLLYNLLPDLLILTAIHKKRWPKYSSKDK